MAVNPGYVSQKPHSVQIQKQTGLKFICYKKGGKFEGTRKEYMFQ